MVDPPASAAGAGRGRHYQARHRRLRRWPRRVLITSNVVVLGLLAAAFTVAGYAVYQLDQIKRIHVQHLITGGPQAHTASGVPAFTILIIGDDSRDLKTATGLNVGNAATNSEDLSDSIILARVVPSEGKLALLSIPRDLFVDVPGLGEQKINAAYAGGDPSRLIEVINDQLGIDVNHYAEVNFDSFEQIADAIGGVEQYFPTPARDYNSGLSIPTAGCVNLHGAQALAFVRSREYEYLLNGEWQYQYQPESDLGRIQRQQAFIKDAIEKAERSGDFRNISTLTSIIGSITTNLTLDTGFSNSTLISLAEGFSHINTNKIPNLTYPVENIPSSSGISPGLERLPGADAATVAEFLDVGTAPATTGKTASPKASGRATTTTTTVPPAGISVEVENGSGATGQAATASRDLESAGFQVSGSGDAPSYTYTANEIEYGPGGRSAASTLADSLTGGGTLEADPALSGRDLVLITGADFDGVGGSSTGATTTAPASTTTTTAPTDGSPYQSATAVIPSSSSYVKGVYIPPGRVPAQKISLCGN